VAGSKGDDAPPPPPPPPPPPKPEPTQAPPKKISVSGGVLQGNAIRKPQPPYPPIAKAARAAGAVQVQVTISEEGKVIDAQVISGHPLLRDAALQAARQWLFKPTELSGVPVKVQGILTFNFTLQ
jgi:protein TonB